MNDSLFIIPTLKAVMLPDGKLGFTRKFVDGIQLTMQYWPGPVHVVAEPGESASKDLDHVAIDPNREGFAVHVVAFTDAPALRELLAGAGLVMPGLDPHQVHFAELCRSVDAPCVYITEYTVKTRREIVRAEVTNPIRRARRLLRTVGLQAKYHEAVRQSTGVQCNGTPTYEEYRPLNPKAMLFFDTRVTQLMVADDEAIARRTREMMSGRPLRLAFSGRLSGMKGADHLPRVAAELARLGVQFTMEIFGDGELRDAIAADVHNCGLGDRVHMRGAVDFKTELMPHVRDNVDLFVCCHRQGDPSCTYLETMSCGVPIAGYDNDAFAGIVRHSGVGWLGPMDDPEALARVIADLNQDRAGLARGATAARDFGAQHTFERTFRARVDHMLECSAREMSMVA